MGEPRIARAGGDPRTSGGHASPTFAKAAEAVVALHRRTWRDPTGTEAQWRASLRTHVLPRIGHMPVHAVETADVMGVLTPIWTDRHVTATRVRHRIAAVMKWAIAQGHRPDNPAGEALAAALPRVEAARTHFRALPHAEIGAALARVRASDKLSVRLALEFLVLCAVRSGEARGARWDEMDRNAATWTIPARRMKAGREHRVPLSDRALAVLDEAAAIRAGALVFPSPPRSDRQLAPDTLGRLLKDLDIDAVPHGFRSSFRDWAAETTDAPHAVMEAALAHAVRNPVEAAYARSDLFERRRELMQRWADYLRPVDTGRAA